MTDLLTSILFFPLEMCRGVPYFLYKFFYRLLAFMHYKASNALRLAYYQYKQPACRRCFTSYAKPLEGNAQRIEAFTPSQTYYNAWQVCNEQLPGCDTIPL